MIPAWLPVLFALASAEIPALLRQLADPDPQTREKAFEALLDLGVQDPQKVLDALPAESDVPEVQDRCQQLRKRIPCERPLREALKAAGDDLDLQEVARELFLEFGMKSLDHLKARASGPERRKAALDILYWRLQLGGPVLEYGIGALAELSDRAINPQILKLLSHPSPEVREVAKDRLRHFPQP